MKKFILVLCLVLCLGTLSFAASENVTVLINRQVKVSYNEELQQFQNVNGVRVYPLSYEGTTYLPIRAISSLFGTEIKWDGATNSVYLGEGDLDTTSSQGIENFEPGTNEEAVVLLNQDIKIYYDGEVQQFEDVNGKVVYPLSYEGTTYLPVRAVSNIFDLKIDWDAASNAVLISDITIDDILESSEADVDTEDAIYEEAYEELLDEEFDEDIDANEI